MSIAQGKEWAQKVHDALAKAGLPRTSTLAGGAITGWTTSYGSTGFSLRLTDKGQIDWHLVISGKPHLRYREFEEADGDGGVNTLEEPVDPSKLHRKIRAVFEGLGLKVLEITNAGYQMMWDDDVDYAVLTEFPDGLQKPARVYHSPGRYR